MRFTLALTVALAAYLSAVCEAQVLYDYTHPGYLFAGALPFTDYYGNVGGGPAAAYGGYGVGQGFPYYPLGYGGYGEGRSYGFETRVPGGVFGHDGCGCDGYGKYGCNC
ncbi:keratin-associated protein 19-3-like [Macrosteles quadrilineatus]|uniref:keratin-associated protein 19-3-like n=1 Tax=Macrosteles quadrilineatus TaxID=74068 RepID=UPI0023E20EB3|nr:keratin-associated protein 19-3-like [Macrosteles quadrilineatus]